MCTDDSPGSAGRRGDSARTVSRQLGLGSTPELGNDPGRMTILGLHHAGVHVASLERSIAFYQAVFGLRPAERLSVGAEQIAFLEAASSHVELIADDTAGRQTGVVDHLALEVDDVDAWVAWLRERGVPLLDQAPIEVPTLSARILFCLGPDGERIELFEHRTPEPAVPSVDVDGGGH